MDDWTTLACIAFGVACAIVIQMGRNDRAIRKELAALRRTVDELQAEVWEK